jgi:signal transduction histidine kinase
VSNLKAINEALTEAKKAEEELSNSRAERLAELEKVRSRIATDLHDDIGASLTQIAILSEIAQAQSKGNGASESLSKITNVSNELVGTMSDIVWSINPSKDHLSDLTQRMRRFASDSLSAKGIIFQFNFSEADKNILVNSNIRREMFLIFKESINNIVKHSAAKRVEIELKVSANDFTLRIQDDGKGFDLHSSFKDSLSSIQMGGNGILSMQKRAEEMNGELEIVSKVGTGTTIELRLPMEIGQTQAPNR